jgi:hypothetical protein
MKEMHWNSIEADGCMLCDGILLADSTLTACLPDCDLTDGSTAEKSIEAVGCAVGARTIADCSRKDNERI